MSRRGIKDEARKLIDELPDDATWEELEYKIYVRRKVEDGLNSLVLKEIPATKGFTSYTPLPEQWWQRSEDLLPTEDQLKFARSHRDLADRRQIAQIWLEEPTGNRIEKYVHLKRDERPDPECLDADLDEYIDALEPSEYHLFILGDLLYIPSPSLRLRLLPIYLEYRVRREIEQNIPFKELRENLGKSPDSERLSKLANDPKAKLSNTHIKGLHLKISQIKRRLVDFAHQIDEVDKKRRLFPDITDELDAWEKRMKEALSLKAELEPPADIDPLTQARQKLAALKPGDEEAAAEFRSYIYRVPKDQEEELLHDILPHLQLATHVETFRHIIDQIDSSAMTTEKATEATQRWLAAYEDASEDRRSVVTEFLQMCLALRRTELRRLFRKRAVELLPTI